MPERPLAEQMRQLLATSEPPGLGPEQRAETSSERVINDAINDALAKHPLPHERGELIRCVVLLWHDHLDAAHQIAQAIETADGSWLHGIMHRRERDYSNAKYWFRRAGNHPAFAELAIRAQPLLHEPGSAKFAARLDKAGAWDSFALVDAVEQALGPGGSEAGRNFLHQLQAVELQTALDYFLAP